MTAKMVDSKNSTLKSGNSDAPKQAGKRARNMPDVATSTESRHSTTLDWVGMSNIALPLQLPNPIRGQDPAQNPEQVSLVNASVQTYVNLNNPNVRGIHMSRLYLLLTQYAESELLTAATLRRFLQTLLKSHEDISDRATLTFSFDQLIKQPALISQYSGWKSYPVSIIATLDNGDVILELMVSVPYSSTCPCSAALARQLIQERFHQDFADQDNIPRETVEGWLRSENGTLATPHSQRSLAQVKVKLTEAAEHFPIAELVDDIEKTLKTPVQTAVKREDEQEFALLNGQNLMFCEDAARRLKSSLMEKSAYKDFWLKVNHLESLHAHDAVSITTRGVPGGYQPDVDPRH